MTAGNLTEEFQALNVSEPECLLFHPTGDKSWLLEKFDDVPRYLFRVFTPRSGGTTDRTWTKSRHARYTRLTRKSDIFATDDDRKVAYMLNKHLRWWRCDDNLVSWTSSLLFALVYIFHLHANKTDGSTFANIHLCIIDTTKFPEGVFLRDMDLIRAYRSFDAQLANFEGLRLRTGPDYRYFGEYLSQGALRIKDKCQIVSAQSMIEQGLFDLQPRFKVFANWELAEKPPWAIPVISLRSEFRQGSIERITKKILQAVVSIAEIFGPGWRLPVAASLIASQPYRCGYKATLYAFRKFHATDDEQQNFSPSKTKVMAYDALPEVQRFNDIMRSVYKEFCLKKMSDSIRQAESQLRCALILYPQVEDNGVEGQDLTSLDSRHEEELRRLETLSTLYRSICSKSVSEEISGGANGLRSKHHASN